MKIENAKQNVAVMLRDADDLPRHALDKLNFNNRDQKVEPISGKKRDCVCCRTAACSGNRCKKNGTLF
jgi:hypothetical protein